MQIQEFMANEYISVCNGEWLQEDCIEYTSGKGISINHKDIGIAADGKFTYDEFRNTTSNWTEHDCVKKDSPTPARDVVWIFDDYLSEIGNLIGSIFGTDQYDGNATLDSTKWGFAKHPGGAAGQHIYTSVFVENHS